LPSVYYIKKTRAGVFQGEIFVLVLNWVIFLI